MYTAIPNESKAYCNKLARVCIDLHRSSNHVQSYIIIIIHGRNATKVHYVFTIYSCVRDKRLSRRAPTTNPRDVGTPEEKVTIFNSYVQIIKY